MSLKYTDVMKPDDINIVQLWTIFAGFVLHPGAPADQREEMRRAFYAGFVECFKIFTDVSIALPEADAVRVLDRISKESHAFFGEMAKRYPEAFK